MSKRVLFLAGAALALAIPSLPNLLGRPAWLADPWLRAAATVALGASFLLAWEAGVRAGRRAADKTLGRP